MRSSTDEREVSDSAAMCAVHLAKERRGSASSSFPSGVRDMALKKGADLKPAKGKLGILMPGMGAVA